MGLRKSRGKTMDRKNDLTLNSSLEKSISKRNNKIISDRESIRLENRNSKGHYQNHLNPVVTSKGSQLFSRALQ